LKNRVLPDLERRAQKHIG